MISVALGGSGFLRTDRVCNRLMREEILTAQVSHRLGKTKNFTGRVLDRLERHNFLTGQVLHRLGETEIFHRSGVRGYRSQFGSISV